MVNFQGPNIISFIEKFQCTANCSIVRSIPVGTVPVGLLHLCVLVIEI